MIWDPGVYAEHGLAALRPILRNVDYFILNHLEFKVLLGTSSPVEVAARLGAVNPGVKVVIKRGAEGCILCSPGEEPLRVRTVPLERLGMRAVNTVGCGDAFIGAFAASLIEGFDEVEALRRGCVAGAFKATRKETRGGPTAKELQELLKRWMELEDRG